MTNEIKFIELLPKTKTDLYEALFEVGDNKDIKIGISHTLISIWNIGNNKDSIELFLKKFGTLQIQFMLAENHLNNYQFISDKFLKADQTLIKYEELEDHLNSKILEAEEKSKFIGFKVD